MNTPSSTTETRRYADCILVSKRVCWDIDRDVIRDRTFDTSQKYLPDGLTFAHRLDFLSSDERRFLSQIQGRTYANLFGLVERFINAKVLEVSRGHWFSDQVALEALLRFSSEELKHQELFRRIEAMIGAAMPEGYTFLARPNDVAGAVLQASTWAVLGLTLHIELFTQSHYRQSIEPDVELSPLFKDVFRYHWLEESQHAILDELEWRRADLQLTAAARDTAVNELIGLVVAVDGILQAQAGADVRYFVDHAGRSFDGAQVARLHAGVLAAYRWQYILSGAEHPRFVKVLSSLVDGPQLERILAALATLR
jgi:hypothetical protein